MRIVYILFYKNPLGRWFVKQYLNIINFAKFTFIKNPENQLNKRYSHLTWGSFSCYGSYIPNGGMCYLDKYSSEIPSYSKESIIY